MKYIIGNWKANKKFSESQEWVDVFVKKLTGESKVLNLLKENKVTVVICPPFHLIREIASLKQYPNIFIGVQNVSIFSPGSYTGEIPAEIISDSADYAIIGHSERRVYFQETEERIEKKVSHAASAGIASVLCLRNEFDTLYENATAIAYEPVASIGTGLTASLEEVLEMKKRLKLSKNQPFLYGGSVKKENCFEYIRNPEIDGFLIGSASLDPLHFYDIIATVE